MNGFVEGTDRGQSTLFPAVLDEYVGEDNPVRAIDVFVDGLDLAKLGFDGVAPLATGRPAYHPAPLLKIYIYGYFNRVQSSGRLERECQRNVEPKIRDEILEDAAALGGKGFSAHFGQQRWLVSRQPALRAIFSRYGWGFRGFQTQICRWRRIVRLPKSTTSARDHDVSGMAPPSRMMRAHRSRIVANMSNMAAPICKKICRPWRTILPAV